MEKSKLLSVIVTTWNSKDYIYNFFSPLKSLLNNSLIEFIIVDDGSNDGTKEEIKKITNSFPKLKIIISEKNHGVSNARNLGIKESNGKWLWFCDVDDNIVNSEELTNFIENDLSKIDNADVVHFSNYTSIKSKLKIDKNSIQKKPNNSLYSLKDHGGIKFNYTPWNKFYLKSNFDKLLWKDVVHEDLFMYLSLLLDNKKVLYINKFFYIYNFHDNGLRYKQEQISLDTLNLFKNRDSNYVLNFHKLIIMISKYRKLCNSMKKDVKLLFKQYEKTEICKWLFSKNIVYKIGFLLLKFRFWFVLWFT